MRKVYIQALQEILADHIIRNGDYLEQAFGMFMSDFLQVSSGVISGLAVSSGSTGTISVATGYLFQDSVYGHLEAASGLTLSLPVSGSRSDLIVGYYDEIEDTITSGYVLTAVGSAIETIEELPSRKIGAIIIEQLANTTYATRPYNKVPLCEITVSSSGITALSDVRIYSRIQRLQEDFQQNFHSMFFSGF